MLLGKWQSASPILLTLAAQAQFQDREPRHVMLKMSCSQLVLDRLDPYVDLFNLELSMPYIRANRAITSVSHPGKVRSPHLHQIPELQIASGYLSTQLWCCYLWVPRPHPRPPSRTGNNVNCKYVEEAYR